MLRLKDESAVNFVSENWLNQSALMVSLGHGMAPAHRPGKMTCCVCQREKQFRVAMSKSKVQAGETDKDSAYYSVKNIIGSTKEN